MMQFSCWNSDTLQTLKISVFYLIVFLPSYFKNASISYIYWGKKQENGYCYDYDLQAIRDSGI